ncbi:hypothetical protein GQ600_6975 [Phytophthora cactorum]|nr:hypothetical protein GQ600_6975 [Phytophthora cactorum]
MQTHPTPTAPLLSCIEQALRTYFSGEASVQDAEDPVQFRAQMLLHDSDESAGSEHDDGQVATSVTADKVLAGVSGESYTAQLAVILHAWHSTGTNPLRLLSTATDEASIEGVTPEFSSRLRVLELSIDVIHSFIDAVEGDADEEVLAATTTLVDGLGGARGLLTLLGFQQTVGSRTLAPLTLRQCLAAFAQRHTPGEQLTVGARAFSKHCARSSSGWWGELKGSDAAKNLRAETKVRELLATATWKNIHSLPHTHATMEIRNVLGYGARRNERGNIAVRRRCSRSSNMTHTWRDIKRRMCLMLGSVCDAVVSSCHRYPSALKPPRRLLVELRLQFIRQLADCFLLDRFRKAPVVYQPSISMRAVQLSCVFLMLAALNAGTNTVAASSCADKVSTGDQSIGISAVADASCTAGGLGCFPYGDQCRFCRESESSQATHLELCSDIQVSMSSATESTQKTESPPSKTTAPVESTVDCLSLVSVGDQGVGISAVAATNPTCAANGLGCFRSGQCRFCQSRATTQSAPFLKCSSLGGTSTTPTSSPTSAPVNSPSPTAASTSTTCSSVVSRSGLEGISYVSESHCNVASPTLLGCSARTSCRLCRNYKNEANQYLISCKVLRDQGATESAAANSSSSGTDETESVASDAPKEVQSSGSLTVMTNTSGVTPASISAPIGAVAAVVALIVVAMMSVIYVKGRRDSYDEPTTPQDCPDGDLLTPNGSNGYTPREGSLVLVESQSSIATL